MADAAKISAPLQAKLTGAADDELVEIVVELDHPPVVRGQSIGERKSEFETRATGVEEKIASVRGSVTGKAWINSTLLARVPACAIRDVADVDGVQRVDVPHALKRE